MFYETIIEQIMGTLEGISAIKEILIGPDSSPKSYPAIIFNADKDSRVMDTTSENFETYKFKMWIVIDLANIDSQRVYRTVMPRTLSAVISAFGSAWSRQINNHRAWLMIDSGSWGKVKDIKGERAYVELSLTYKVSNDI